MVFHLNSAGVITCVFYKLKAKMEGLGTGASSSCLKCAASEDVYKEMPHHGVESTSPVVTGFFTDVLGSGVA